MVPRLRVATAADGAFLPEMLGCAFAWRPGAAQPWPDELLGRPDVGHSIADWSRTGDHGVVAAIEECRVGAA